MIKTFLFTFLFAFACSFGLSQTNKITDSLKHELAVAKDDTSRIQLKIDLCKLYRLGHADSSVIYGQQALKEAQEIKYPAGEIQALSFMSVTMENMGNLATSLEMAFKALQIAESNHLENLAVPALNAIGEVYTTLKDYPKAVSYFQRQRTVCEGDDNTEGLAYAWKDLGQVFEEINQLDSAIYCEQRAIAEFRKTGREEPLVYETLGDIKMKSGDRALALDFYRQGLQVALTNNEHRASASAFNKIAVVYKYLDQKDSGIYYAKKGLEESELISQKKSILEATSLLSELYSAKDPAKAFQYLKIADAYKDSLFGAGNIQAIQALVAQEEAHQKEIEDARIKYQYQLKQYAFLAGLGILLLVAFILYRNNKQKQKANKVLANTLTNLEETQVQLVDKNHDLEIEGALERVRSSALAMKEPADMLEVCRIIAGQLAVLNVKEIRNVQTAIFYETKGVYINYEFYAKHDKTLITEVDYSTHAVQSAFANQMLKGPNEFFTHGFTGQQVQDWYAYQKTTNVFLDSYLEHASSLNYYWYSLGPVALGMSTYLPLSEEQIILFQRFRNVFGLAYRRYLDIEKAEAQARESQIQLALERVRARTMAMHKSDELTEVAAILFKQIGDLGINTWTTGFNVWSDDNNFYTDYITSPQGNVIKTYTIDARSFSVFADVCDSKKRGEEFWVQYLSGDLIKETYKRLSDFGNEGQYEKMLEDGVKFPDQQYDHFVFGGSVSLMFITYEPVPEAHDIFKRFAKVFEQTYTRFLDLQKAEAQAREAQIQLALERVRARTMAMFKSDELSEVAFLLFQQFKELGERPDQATIGIINENDWVIEYWVTMYGSQNNKVYKFSIDEPNVTNKIYKAWKEQNKFIVIDLSGKELRDFMHYRQSMGGAAVNETEQRRIINVAFFSKGIINVQSNEERSAESIRLLERFAAVFELTYTRFLDLQKAEAQAREAQIEAALERVRSRSMGMQKSEELREVIQVIYEQLIQLNFNISNAGFLMDYRESDDGNIWMTDATTEFPTKQHLPWFDHPFNDDYLEQRDKGPELFTKVYSFEEKNTWWEVVLKYLPGVSEETKKALLGLPALALSRVLMKHIGLYLLNYTGIPYSDAENATLMRFGKVFEQTYTRFKDLEKAEAQSLEAIKRASVDRVRAEIASMRTTNDLERITPLIWNELTTLGVSFIRCGVFIMDEEQEQIHTFLSTPDGQAIAAFNTPFANPGTITAAIPYWRRKEMYKAYWDAATFMEQVEILVKQGAIQSPEKYFNQSHPTDLYLHFLPFLQGMLYAGNTTPLSDDELELVQNLADAFSTAYARYEDFNKLEAAKQQVDKTLGELKSTQSQLIQSEKMASLGELTAGIAHEIQNPLNFVNNFSDINTELIEELKQELQSGNTEDAMEISNDIKQNEEKINHHGKRADAIVKGMLQHSQKSTGQKEATDINKLADEYLRLSYHGLRAKNKDFNADIKTEFDENVGKVNIIPQDIGRVLLNLYNNAFYAVRPTNPLKGEDYEPTVTVTTKRINSPLGDRGKILISVKDNGNGISQKIVDKIFQPFFTTKPTGEGTGLGLSLSYDIVKSHDGELKVETKEGEGSEFIIQLPVV